MADEHDVAEILGQPQETLKKVRAKYVLPGKIIDKIEN